MRKIFIFTVVMLTFASLGFAAQVSSKDNTADTSLLVIGGGADLDGATPTVILSVGLSSQVTAVYENGGSGTNPQWYAIAAAHLGGKQMYGTAQDVSNVYKLPSAAERTPGTIPVFTTLPADNTASGIWTSTAWEKM